jgi:hypothetical protein
MSRPGATYWCVSRVWVCWWRTVHSPCLSWRTSQSCFLYKVIITISSSPLTPHPVPPTSPPCPSSPLLLALVSLPRHLFILPSALCLLSPSLVTPHHLILPHAVHKLGTRMVGWWLWRWWWWWRRRSQQRGCINIRDERDHKHCHLARKLCSERLLLLVIS